MCMCVCDKMRSNTEGVIKQEDAKEEESKGWTLMPVKAKTHLSPEANFTMQTFTHFNQTCESTICSEMIHPCMGGKTVFQEGTNLVNPNFS